MQNLTETGLLTFFIILICGFLLYSGLPNLWVRVFQRGALRDLNSKNNAKTSDKVVLTFDDGPDPRYTPRLLDALKAAEIRATFFVIAAKAERNPDIVKQMVSDGHDVQIHGYRHFMVPFLSPHLTIQQITRSSGLLNRQFGIETRWYRPTWGLCNAVTLLSPATRSHRLVTWSVMVGDWKRTSPPTLLERIERKLHPGAIIVLHDSDETFGADEQAPESVIALIPALKNLIDTNGLQFVTLSEATTQM